MSQGAGPQDPIEPSVDAGAGAGERLDSTWWDVENGDDDAEAGAAVSFPGDDGYDTGAVAVRSDVAGVAAGAAGAAGGNAFELDDDEADRAWRPDAADAADADADADRITFGAKADDAVRSTAAAAAAAAGAAPVTRAATATDRPAVKAGAASASASGGPRRVAAATARRRRWPIVAGVALLGAAAIALISQAGGSKSDKSASTTVASTPATTIAASTVVPASVAPTTVATTASATTVARTTIAPTTVAPTTAAPAPTTTAPRATSASAGSPANPAAVDVLKPVRWAIVIKGPKVYLRGRVPSQAVADDLRAKVGRAAGDENVFVEYTIDPSAPLPADAPVFITDTVLFDPDSTVIRPEFQPILELGRVSMEQNPKVTVTVIGRADARGDADYNLQLSRDRAQATVDFMARTGVSRSRFTIIAKGADQPIGDQSTSAGMQANRAVEFIAFGFLDN